LTPLPKTAETAEAAKRQEQSEAWLQAVAQARALGMLDGGCRFLLDRRSAAPDTHADFKPKQYRPSQIVRRCATGIGKIKQPFFRY
jgi:hypothetical protein